MTGNLIRIGESELWWDGDGKLKQSGLDLNSNQSSQLVFDDIYSQFNLIVFEDIYSHLVFGDIY